MANEEIDSQLFEDGAAWRTSLRNTGSARSGASREGIGSARYAVPWAAAAGVAIIVVVGGLAVANNLGQKDGGASIATSTPRPSPSLTGSSVRSPSSIGAGLARSSAAEPVPSTLGRACGRPGSIVTVAKLPVTVPRSACDLRGVIVTLQGAPQGVEGIVPEGVDQTVSVLPEASPANVAGISIVVATNGDVTIAALPASR